MKIHHLNCGSLCPVGGLLMDGKTISPSSSHLSCHCLLIETDAHGLVLVDTGIGLEDIRSPQSRISPFFLKLCRPTAKAEDTALSQVEHLGFSRRDVRHIILTHLDFDHAGGIDDFPEATLHLLAAEKAAALHQAGWIARRRYRPQQFRNHTLWKTYDTSGETWFGFEAVKQLTGLPPEILLVPLIGHTLGHAGVAIQDTGRWLLHAGDAYFYHKEMDRLHYCTPGLRAYQWLMDTDRHWRVVNQQRLRKLVHQHGEEVRVFSAHDMKELEKLREETARIQQTHEAA